LGESWAKSRYVSYLFREHPVKKVRKTAELRDRLCVDIAGVASSILATPTSFSAD
jgi:hypothetical protein